MAATISETTIRCKYHCVKCERHFADQESWKAHYENPGQYEGCKAPDRYLFETLRGDTACRVNSEALQHEDFHFGVRVWIKREDYRERRAMQDLQKVRARGARTGMQERTHDGIRNNYGVV